MRVGTVRTDIGHIYLNDVENRSQRNFSSQPPGQSRYFHKPSTTELTALLGTYAYLTVAGTNAAATVNTSTNNTLRIRASAAASFSVIVVTTGATTAKTTIAADLNIAFTNAALALVASVDSTNHLHIDTKAPNNGPTAYLEIDTTGNGSTLNTAVGFTAGGTILSGMSVATLVAAVYPTATTINVSTATIAALSTFAAQTAAQQVITVAAIADAIAPTIVETGPALLSFVYGALSKMRVASFQPGGTRVGLPAGIAVAITATDGSTPFTL